MSATLGGRTEMNEDLMRRYYATYNSEDPEALSAFYHPDCRLESAQGTMRGRDEILATYRYLIAAFEDRMTPLDIRVEGDTAEVDILDHFTARVDIADFMGQSLAAGECFELKLQARYRAENGLLREIRIAVSQD